MATLEEINRHMEIDIYPYQQDLDKPITFPVENVSPIIIKGDDVGLFLDWASCVPWRRMFEENLQGIAKDSQNRPLLTTWIPLVIFRYQFCGGGRQLQNEVTQKLMDRLYIATREWRDAGTDWVDVSGYFIN